MKNWIKTRRALSINMIEKEAGMTQGTLSKYLNGKRGLPDKHRERLLEVLKKYGYKGNLNIND
jgi:DNA-binding LacI/PurR family transcriptional regulator